MQHFSKDKTILLKNELEIDGRRYDVNHLPQSLKLYPELGVAVSRIADVRRIHIDEFTCHPRSIVTQSGEILLFYAAGNLHYGWMSLARGSNQMYLIRSRDNGQSWSAPEPCWQIPYGQHAAVPLRPGNGKRIYVFTTEPAVSAGYRGGENSPLGMRYSDDDGHHWSLVSFIRPQNYPEFTGMSAMRAAECQDGSWILGSHCGEAVNDRYTTCLQYFLRTADQGKSWEILPGRQGWSIPEGRIHEGRPLCLPDGRLLGFFRTSEGHIWVNQSADNGQHWTIPAPSVLKHLEAPPMVFLLEDGRLVCFLHNKASFDNAVHQFAHEIRAELYVTVSLDQGKSWSEPKIFAVEAGTPPVHTGWGGTTPMVSYCDLLQKDGMLHLFIDHEMRQVLQASFSLADFNAFLDLPSTVRAVI